MPSTTQNRIEKLKLDLLAANRDDPEAGVDYVCDWEDAELITAAEADELIEWLEVNRG